MAELKVFGHLFAEVIKVGRCTLCGACAAVCPVGIIHVIEDKPVIKGRCIMCGVCYHQCPRTGGEFSHIESMVFRRSCDPLLGCYKGVYAARTKLENVARVCQDGGIATTALVHALEEGIIDSAVVTVRDEVWRSGSKVATTAEDVVKSAGTKYTASPTLIGVREAFFEKDRKAIGVVGRPCEVYAARKMQYYPEISGFGDSIAFIVGLFCMESFDYKPLFGYLAGAGIDARSIGKFTITKGKFIVTGVNGEVLLSTPIKKMRSYVRSACHYCEDFTALLADISVGSVGSPDGWSTVIVRTEVGEEVFGGMVEKGYVEAKLIDEVKPGLPLVVKLAESKRKEAAKHLEEIQVKQR